MTQATQGFQVRRFRLTKAVGAICRLTAVAELVNVEGLSKSGHGAEDAQATSGSSFVDNQLKITGRLILRPAILTCREVALALRLLHRVRHNVLKLRECLACGQAGSAGPAADRHLRGAGPMPAHASPVIVGHAAPGCRFAPGMTSVVSRPRTCMFICKNAHVRIALS